MAESRKIYRIQALDINQINWQLAQLANRLDELEGWRGTPTFRSDLDIQSNKIRSMADATAQDDAVALSQLGAGVEDYAGDTVVEETAFGQSSTAGVSTDYSRADHTHGTISDPFEAYTVETHDENTVLTATDLLKIHVMDVSGGERNFTLPAVGEDDVGNWIMLVRSGTANALLIHAGGMNTILNTTPGGYIECDEDRDFSSLTLIVVADGQWVTPEYGIWTTY